jgi:hypothetical protein
MKFCEYMDSDWFKALEREVNASNKTRVAEKMDVSRSTLSAVMNGIGEYGKGKASTVNFEREFRRAYEQLPCPYNGTNVGTAYCREHALSAAPTHNPLQMMHWQACQQCSHKPRPVPAVAPASAQSIVITKGDSKPAEPAQQAGIIDKVTLPLPEVGAPQIASQSQPATAGTV